MKKLFFVVILFITIFCSCDHPEKMAWNYDDYPKSICDTTLPEGKIISTYWSHEGLIVTITSNGKITKWVKDENLREEYLINDTIKHCN